MYMQNIGVYINMFEVLRTVCLAKSKHACVSYYPSFLLEQSVSKFKGLLSGQTRAFGLLVSKQNTADSACGD